MVVVMVRSRFVVVVIVGAFVGAPYLHVRSPRRAAVGIVFWRPVGAVVVLRGVSRMRRLVWKVHIPEVEVDSSLVRLSYTQQGSRGDLEGVEEGSTGCFLPGFDCSSCLPCLG